VRPKAAVDVETTDAEKDKESLDVDHQPKVIERQQKEMMIN